MDLLISSQFKHQQIQFKQNQTWLFTIQYSPGVFNFMAFHVHFQSPRGLEVLADPPGAN
jgi:hypothetical protein